MRCIVSMDACQTSVHECEEVRNGELTASSSSRIIAFVQMKASIDRDDRTTARLEIAPGARARVWDRSSMPNRTLMPWKLGVSRRSIFGRLQRWEALDPSSPIQPEVRSILPRCGASLDFAKYTIVTRRESGVFRHPRSVRWNTYAIVDLGLFSGVVSRTSRRLSVSYQLSI